MRKFLICCILALATMVNPPLIFSVGFSMMITIIILLTSVENFLGEDNVRDILENMTPSEEASEKAKTLLIIMLLFFIFNTLVLFNIFSNVLIK